jgi:hypothetical protein
LTKDAIRIEENEDFKKSQNAKYKVQKLRKDDGNRPSCELA